MPRCEAENQMSRRAGPSHTILDHGGDPIESDADWESLKRVRRAVYGEQGFPRPRSTVPRPKPKTRVTSQSVARTGR